MRSPFKEQSLEFTTKSVPQQAFTYALVPVLFDANNQILGAVYKKKSADAKASAILTLAFSLALNTNTLVQETVIREFFDFCTNGPVSPDPAVLGFFSRPAYQ